MKIWQNLDKKRNTDNNFPHLDNKLRGRKIKTLEHIIRSGG